MEAEQNGELAELVGQPEALLFINTSHPRDATTKDSLSQIRSHAAKEVRSRARRSRKDVPLLGDRSEVRKLTQHSGNSRQGNARGNLALASSEGQEGVEAHGTVFVLSSSLQGQPRDLFWGNPLWSPIRPFSDKEHFLLEHYINYIVPFGNGSCHKDNDGSGQLIATQLNHWVPFALSDFGLIAGLFLQSCRSLGALCQGYEDMSVNYRLQCIQSTNAALGTEAMQISDATIAKVMIMASEEFTSGSFNTWAVHLAAITQMVKMRGGVDTLGVGGFLKDIMVKTPICYGY